MMGRSPCCDENGLKKGPWTPDEDRLLVEYIRRNGHGSWSALPKLAGLNRGGKSCRLRWTNYLRPDIKRGKFSDEEEQLIINLHSVLGNKWSAIASRLPGRTDNEIKNFWNTHLKKKLLRMGIDPITHRPRTDLNILANLPQLLAAADPTTFATPVNSLDKALRLQTDVAKIQLLLNIIQVLNSSQPPSILALSLLGQSQFRENHLLEYPKLNSNPQVQGLGNNNGSVGLTPQSFQMASSFSNFECLQNMNSNYFQTITNSEIFGEDIHNFKNEFGIPNHNSFPALVSTTPEPEFTKNVNQSENKINPDISNPSSSSTTLEAWGDLMDDEACDYWREIIQASSPQGPMSS